MTSCRHAWFIHYTPPSQHQRCSWCFMARHMPRASRTTRSFMGNGLRRFSVNISSTEQSQFQFEFHLVAFSVPCPKFSAAVHCNADGLLLVELTQARVFGNKNLYKPFRTPKAREVYPKSVIRISLCRTTQRNSNDRFGLNWSYRISHKKIQVLPSFLKRKKVRLETFCI